MTQRKLREQMQLAEDRAQDAEIAAKLNEDLEHMQTELSKTKQSLTTTSSELTQVRVSRPRPTMTRLAALVLRPSAVRREPC